MKISSVFSFFIFAVFLQNISMLCAAEKEKSQAEDILERRQKVQLKGFFIKDAKDAVLPEAPMAVTLYNQAVVFFQHQEYDLARQSLQDALQYDNANGFIYELLGDVDNLQQKLPDAKKNYEIAYNLNPRADTKQKLEKLGKEQNVVKKLATYKEEHFVIKYHKDQEKDKGFELRELLRTTYKKLSADFGYYFNRQVVVILYDEADFKQLSDLPHWAAGVYDGKVRMPINREGFTDQDLNALTAHEVTHAFVAGMSAERAPAWINEGLAQYQENKVKPIEMIVFESAVTTNTLLPLFELMKPGAVSKIKDPLLANLFYQQSFHLVSYLIKRYGMFMVKQMLQEYAKGKDSEEIIESKLRISSERLEREWKATFTKE